MIHPTDTLTLSDPLNDINSHVPPGEGFTILPSIDRTYIDVKATGQGCEFGILEASNGGVEVVEQLYLLGIVKRYDSDIERAATGMVVVVTHAPVGAPY